MLLVAELMRAFNYSEGHDVLGRRQREVLQRLNAKEESQCRVVKIGTQCGLDRFDVLALLCGQR